MVLVGVGLLLRGRTRFDAARTTVVADMGFRNICDSRVVGVVNYGGINAIHVSVVGEATAFPAASLVSHAAVAEAVIDAAIEAYLRPPIAFMEKERVAAPAP